MIPGVLGNYLLVTEIRHTDVVKLDDFPYRVNVSKLVICSEPVRHQHVNNGMNSGNAKREIVLRRPDY